MRKGTERMAKKEVWGSAMWHDNIVSLPFQVLYMCMFP